MIIVVIGVSGSGKTTIGRMLGERPGFTFFDADELHPIENIEKMSNGVPLTDADRLPWLYAVRDRAVELAASCGNVVVACSALKEIYRDILRSAGDVTFIYLKGTRSLILSRIAKRKGHFMPNGLLDSQFDALEEPNDGLAIDITHSPEVIVETIWKALGRGDQ